MLRVNIWVKVLLVLLLDACLDRIKCNGCSASERIRLDKISQDRKCRSEINFTSRLYDMALHFDRSIIERFRTIKSLDKRPGKMTGEQYEKCGRTHALTKVRMAAAGVPNDFRRLTVNDNFRIFCESLSI